MKKKVASAISLVILILILLYVSGIVAQFMINIKAWEAAGSDYSQWILLGDQAYYPSAGQGDAARWVSDYQPQRCGWSVPQRVADRNEQLGHHRAQIPAGDSSAQDWILIVK